MNSTAKAENMLKHVEKYRVPRIFAGDFCFVPVRLVPTLCVGMLFLPLCGHWKAIINGLK